MTEDLTTVADVALHRQVDAIQTERLARTVRDIARAKTEG